MIDGIGAGRKDRTPGFRVTRAALFRLSYASEKSHQKVTAKKSQTVAAPRSGSHPRNEEPATNSGRLTMSNSATPARASKSSGHARGTPRERKAQFKSRFKGILRGLAYVADHRSLLPFGGGCGLRRLRWSSLKPLFGLLALTSHAVTDDARARPIARSIGRPGGGGCGEGA